MLIKLFTDAATRYETGASAAGVVAVLDGQQHQFSVFLGDHLTNHEAEFLAAIRGFEFLDEHAAFDDTIFFYTDSRLVSDSLGKDYTGHYATLLAQLTTVTAPCKLIITQWVPEKSNQGAHHLALQALPKR